MIELDKLPLVGNEEIRLTDGTNTMQCSIRVVGADHVKSHAGIFIILNGQPVTGSMSFEQLPNVN